LRRRKGLRFFGCCFLFPDFGFDLPVKFHQQFDFLTLPFQRERSTDRRQ
jgi:hypothetical protein